MNPNKEGEPHMAFEYRGPKYYSDQVRCFIPSCGKYRRDNPDIKFLVIPDTLKENWCRAIERNCPRRSLHVCEDHINIDRDCYTAKDGSLRLKHTANLTIITTHDIVDCDAQTQWKVEVKNKGVMAKPSTSSVGSGRHFIHNVSGNMMPSRPNMETLSTSITSSGTSTPVSIYYPSSFSSSPTTKENKNLSGRQHIMKLIEENPKMNIGIPEQYFWILDYLTEQCKIKRLNIILTLYKLKLNDTAQRIADQFMMSKENTLKAISIALPRLASFFQNFIYLPNSTEIKKTLPPAFKIRFSKVQCIIDCFEIEIEKPSDPLLQARTWSQYKNCNTIKYLIACCPNGFICFISKGFGGRMSDKAITEQCGFVDILPPGATVMADRGFKGLDSLLAPKDVQLLRPPSVSANEQPYKEI